jgi:hypothetical protein
MYWDEIRFRNSSPIMVYVEDELQIAPLCVIELQQLRHSMLPPSRLAELVATKKQVPISAGKAIFVTIFRRPCSTFSENYLGLLYKLAFIPLLILCLCHLLLSVLQDSVLNKSVRFTFTTIAIMCVERHCRPSVRGSISHSV